MPRTVPTLMIVCFAGCVGLLADCTSRTLPLPPPEVSSVSLPNSLGQVTVSGYALEGASIGVVNDRTLAGTITTSAKSNCDRTCPFTATVPAKSGDGLRVWQFFETEGSIEEVVPTP